MVEIIWACGAKRLEVHHAPWGRVAVLAEGTKLRGVWPLPCRTAGNQGEAPRGPSRGQAAASS